MSLAQQQLAPNAAAQQALHHQLLLLRQQVEPQLSQARSCPPLAAALASVLHNAKPPLCARSPQSHPRATFLLLTSKNSRPLFDCLATDSSKRKLPKMP